MKNYEYLREKAATIRKLIVEMMAKAGSGHIGGALSIVEILAVLYHGFMRINPHDHKWPERDRFVLSKGHAGPALYAALHTVGFLSYNDLMTLNKNDTRLPSHCDMRKTPGIDMFGGSLGMGLSAAAGIALAAQMDSKDIRVFFIIGDGECNEGQIWEAAMTAAKYKLGNLIGFVDYNKLQVDGPVAKVMPLEPLQDKWRSFNWHVQQIDGHNVEAVHNALLKAAALKNMPSIIIADTVKGKGLSFTENALAAHNMKFSAEMINKAFQELK